MLYVKYPMKRNKQMKSFLMVGTVAIFYFSCNVTYEPFGHSDIKYV